MEQQIPRPRRTPNRRFTTKARIAWVVVIGAALVPIVAPNPAGATVPDSVFVAVGGQNDSAPACDHGRSVTSQNSAVSWPIVSTMFTPTPAPCADGGELYDIAVSGSVWVAVGTKQLANGTTQGVTFRSTNSGASWTAGGTVPPTPGGVLALEAVATNGSGRWLAGGYQRLYFSDNNGATWNQAQVLGSPGAGWRIHDIAEQPGLTESWTAVGGNDLNVGAPGAGGITMTASTGTSWMSAGWSVGGANYRFGFNGVAIDPSGDTVVVGSTRVASDAPGVFGFVAFARAPNGGWLALDQSIRADTSMGGLNQVATDWSGQWIAVGSKKTSGNPDAVAYRIPQIGTSWGPWIGLSPGLPFGTGSLEGIATDRLGTWVAVGGDQGATTRSTDLGATWSAEIQNIPGAKGIGLLRSVEVAPGGVQP